MIREPQRRRNARKSGWYWSRYWRPGRAGSCIQPGGGQSGVLARLWNGFFGGLPSGAEVLDLATGAGEVARRAARIGRGLGVTGVDYAELPREVEGVRLIDGVRIEALPFPPESFDAVVSQFGFEYADRPPAAREAARVMKPGGRGVLVLHHAESGIGADYARRAAAYRAAMLKHQPSRWGRRVFKARVRGLGGAELETLDAAFRAAVSAAEAELPEDTTFADAWEMINYLRVLAADPGRYQPNDALLQLDDFDEVAEAWLLRQAAQARASLDAAGAHALTERLRRLGLNCEPAEPFAGDDGDVLAWLIRFEKPPRA